MVESVVSEVCEMTFEQLLYGVTIEVVHLRGELLLLVGKSSTVFCGDTSTTCACSFLMKVSLHAVVAQEDNILLSPETCLSAS